MRVKGGMSLQNGMWHGLPNNIIMRNVIYGNAQRNKLNRKSYTRLCRVFFGRRLFFGTTLKEQLPAELLCWLKPTRQSSTLEFTRIMEEIISSSGKLYEAARKL